MKLSPLPEPSAADVAAERARRRDAVDARVVDQMAAAPDEQVPPEVLAVVADVDVVMRAGVPADAVERLLVAGAKADGNARAAIVERARKVQGRQAERAAARPLPDLDADDLLADCPAALAASRAVARRALACPDLTVLAFLSAVSCALAAKVVGVTRNNDGSVWRIWPHLYVAAEAPSGANKTLIANAMLRHVLADPWDAIAERMAVAEARDGEERERAANERLKLRRADPESEKIEQCALRLRQPKVLAPVVLEDGSSTPQQWVRCLQWSGFGAVVPDEAADWLAQFIGGRDQQMRVAPLLNAWGGDPFSYRSIAGEQRGDDRPMFRHLHAAALLLLQPGVLAPTTRDEQARLHALHTRGVFPRMMVARPRPLTIAERHALEDDVTRHQDGGEAEALYGEILRALARASVPGHPLQPQIDRRPAPLEIGFALEATRARRAYQVACGDEVAADGPSRGQLGERYVARLHDHAARVAICLAAWRQAHVDVAAGRPVDLRAARVELADIERAIRLCEGYLRPHGDAAASRTVLDEAGDDAEMLRAALDREVKRSKSATVSQRDVQHRLGRGWDKRRVERARTELEARGGVIVDGSGTRGRVNLTLIP